MTEGNGRWGVASTVVLGAALLLGGCKSEPQPHLARVNASILSWVVCAGVDTWAEGVKDDPKAAICNAAKGAEATMDPAPSWGEVAVFEMAQIRFDTTPHLPVAAPGQPAGRATVGPYKDMATCEAVRGVVSGLGIDTKPCEPRYMAGKLMFARTGF